MNQVLDLTVIVPYFNEEHSVLRTLALLSKQSVLPKEVILVNSSSTDRSSAVIDRWIQEQQSQSVIRFQNVFEHTNTPGSSKNVGVRHATTAWIAFMDCGLDFCDTWLESQWSYAKRYGLQAVLGQVLAKGRGLIDVLSTAQTVGLYHHRECVPGTILLRSAFNTVGFFLDNRRAGYDVGWKKQLQRSSVKYRVNPAFHVCYDEPVFSLGLRGVIKKSFVYASASVNVKYYSAPYYYLVAFILSIVWFIFFPIGYSAMFCVLYLILRGYFVPWRKCKRSLFLVYPSALILSPIIGLCIDCAKMAGILQGCFRYHVLQRS